MDDPDLAGARHFSGTNTGFVVRFLRAEASHRALDDVLTMAGETRTPDELSDGTTWSSYDQFRRLLEATAQVLGGLHQLVRVGRYAIGTVPQAEVANTLQALGSPNAVYAEVGASGVRIAPVIDVRGDPVGETECVISQYFRPGFAPFKEYCHYSSGLFSVVTRLFGYPAADVIEEDCQCDGAPVCRFRVTWVPTDEPIRLAEYWELRARVLEAQLAAMQRTVADLVSGEDLETVLQRIVASAGRTLAANGFVLALHALPTAGRRVYTDGVSAGEAERMAGGLLGGRVSSSSRRLVAEVASTRASYGRLAAIVPEGAHFYELDHQTLETYARLAAAALDSAAALEDARRQALHDGLTGLPNRALILDRAEHMVVRARRDGHDVAALFIDLDNFKTINDTLGHGAGDEVLREVARRLATAVRDEDTVGRLGGDEFVVLTESLAEAAEAEVVAARILDALREPFAGAESGGAPVTVTASIGIAVSSTLDVDDLLHHADQALYRAKATGKDGLAFFSAEMRPARPR